MTGDAQAQTVRLQILTRGSAAPVVTISAPAVRIGRDPTCEIFIDHPDVSRVQCAIHSHRGQALLVVGQTRTPTLVNGVKASNTTLTAGDVLTIGPVTLRFDPDEDDAIDLEDAGTPDPLADALQLEEGDTDGDMPSLELEPGMGGDTPVAMVEGQRAVPAGGADQDVGELDAADSLELDAGRADDEHTRILPRGARSEETPAGGGGRGRDDDEHTRILPRSRAPGAAPPPAAPPPLDASEAGRDDGDKTAVLPRGGPAPGGGFHGGQAVILSDGTGARDAVGEDELDPQRLSVAVRQQIEQEPKEAAVLKGPLQNNGVRAAMLLLMLALAALAWKDSLFPNKELPTARASTGGGGGDLTIVGDRGGRSDEELIADAQKEFDVGSKKLEEHHLQDENLTSAIHHLTQAQVTLALLGTPPPLAEEVDAKLREAEQLREDKYRDALFHVQKLRREGDLRACKAELEYIMRLLADETDPRYVDAQRELVVIEEQMKDGRR